MKITKIGFLIVSLLVSMEFVAESQNMTRMKILKRDPDRKGLLCEYRNKKILMVSGTPEQMGKAHGTLLKSEIDSMYDKIFLIGGAYSVAKNDWFFTRIKEVQKRTSPFIPERFSRESDAMAAAAGLTAFDCKVMNLFPEMFHCSGVAVRNKASKDGRILHARVLDYMRDIGLQQDAVLMIFMPDGLNNWLSVSYAGFIGTVTAINDQGLAVGEMGGGGNGDWDGMPMSFLLREIMEKAATVDEAVEICRKTPRTCEYYYVISDKHKNMVGVYSKPGKLQILKPGQQDGRLPFIPDDTVMISAGARAKALSERILKYYGKIDVKTMIEIIKRPVAMKSNLHNAIFAPETLDVWFADAGENTPACDEPYVQVNLARMIEFFNNNRIVPARTPNGTRK